MPPTLKFRHVFIVGKFTHDQPLNHTAQNEHIKLIIKLLLKAEAQRVLPFGTIVSISTVLLALRMVSELTTLAQRKFANHIFIN